MNVEIHLSVEIPDYPNATSSLHYMSVTQATALRDKLTEQLDRVKTFPEPTTTAPGRKCISCGEPFSPKYATTPNTCAVCGACNCDQCTEAK